MKMAFWALAATSLLGVSGCANEHSIFRTTDLTEESVITDAKQRVVISSPASKHVGFNRPNTIVCAEPSPDVAQALSESFSLALQAEIANQGSGELATGFSAVESIAQLGERLATIQMLRDGFYRACEAYANGAITDATYAVISGGIDDLMATLLSAELAAGAFGRNLAAIGGSASTTAGQQMAADMEALKTKLEKRETLAGEIAALEAQEKNATEENPFDKGEELASKRAEAKAVEESIHDLTSLSATTSARGTPQGTPGGGIGCCGGTSNSQQVARIHENFLRQERGVGSLTKACVVALDRVSSRDYYAYIDSNRLGTTADRDHTLLAEVCMKVITGSEAGTTDGESMFTKILAGQQAHERDMAEIAVRERLALALERTSEECNGTDAGEHCAALIRNLEAMLKLIETPPTQGASTS